MADKKTKPVTSSQYENNPFFVASNGITLLFNLARGVAIMLLVISILSLFSPNWSAESSDPGGDFGRTVSSWSASDWVLAAGSVAVISLAIVMVSALFSGVSAYTASRLAINERVELREAFREAFDNLWSYLWLQIIITVKVVLWSLLFIVPGVIMAVRYSLSGVAFYDEKKQLRGNAAIKESLRLTKGAWITTYASSALFNLLTFGALSSVIASSVNAVLYKQYNELGDAQKPAAHWLSWVTLFLPAVLLALVFMFIIVIAVAVGVSGGHLN